MKILGCTLAEVVILSKVIARRMKYNNEPRLRCPILALCMNVIRFCGEIMCHAINGTQAFAHPNIEITTIWEGGGKGID
jgi:hypothetical protein